MGRVSGIIFSSLNSNTHSRLTANRTVAAIPFACRYRLIDFCISNMVNADIYNISVVANYNYRSLLEHLGSGKDYDLARRSGGINFVSPFQYIGHISEAKMFSTHLEALISMYKYIEELNSEEIVLMDSDTVLNIDLKNVIAYHRSKQSLITFVTKPINEDFTSKHQRIMIRTENGQISDLALSENYEPMMPELYLGIAVINRLHLIQIIEEAIARNYNSLTSYIIKHYTEKNFYAYTFNEYAATLSGFTDYYRYSMELLNNSKARESLFNSKRGRIYTRIHNSSPKLYTDEAVVKNSMLADESVIDGTIINSIVFRGVRVEKGAIVKNSILFHGTHVAKNARLNCIVTDKNVYVSEGCELSGNESIPFYIEKGRKV